MINYFLSQYGNMSYKLEDHLADIKIHYESHWYLTYGNLLDYPGLSTACINSSHRKKGLTKH